MTTARATGAAGATSAARLEDIARRLSSLPHDKQDAFTGWLAERGISVLSLPIVPQLRTAALPLSFAQRRLWLLDRLHPGSAQYNIPRIYALAGALDRDAMARALGDLVVRHEALRTTFGELDGEPVQRIAAAPPLDLVIEHAGDLATARAIADDEAARPFDLARGVFRVRVLRIAGDLHWLLVTSHHIAMDEWSDAIVARELAELYDAHHRRRAHRLAALPIQYADFALWQRRWLTDDVLASQLAHWRAELGIGDHEPALAVEAGTGGHARADALRFRLEPALDARLRAFAARARTTLFTTLLAVFQIALHRLGGSRDLRIGSPIANRNRREIEGVIGCFANTQVLRAQLAPGMTFAHHLEAVKRTVAAAQSHQDLPFERLVEALAPERALGETPLFQVMFSWHRGAADLHAAAGGLTITQEPAIDRVAKFDLVLHMTDDETQIEGELLYRTARLSRDVIAALADGVQRIAAAAVETPDRPIAALPVIADAAHERITCAWNATGTTAIDTAATRAAMTRNAVFDGLHARIAAWARVTPDAPALQCEGERLDYRALDERAAVIAGALAARGVRPEDRVAVCLPRSIDLVVGMLGIMSCGAAYVPLDPRTPPERLRELLGDARIAHAIARGDAADLLRALGVDVLDDADPSALPLRAHVSPDTAAYVIYTSGSTGRPKGVVVHHGAITGYVCGVRERLALPAGAAMALVSTPTADLGHTVLFGALVGGGLLHVVAEDRCFDADRMAAYLRANPVDVLKITPSHLGGLLQAASPADVLPRHALILGGEAAPAELLARIRGLAPCRIINHYGPTETTVGVLTYEARDGEDRLPLGTPLPGRQAYVLDAALAPQPPGMYGELYIGGEGVARGYLGRPGTTADRFVPDPFRPDGGRLYRTGDRARYRADGAIEFAGRTDDQIKLRGHRIEPGEVRAALLRAPGVADAHAALHDAGTGPRLIGYMVAAGARPDDVAVLAAVAAWLPEHMVPAELVWLERFPVTANGKIDRKALPAPGRPVVAASRAPSNELECQIAAVWCDVLQRDSVGIDDRFFTIGGDSLLAFQVVARLREAGMSLTIPELFANQTIAALARVVRSGGGDAATALAVPVEGDVALTPIQHWFFDHALERPQHYNQSVLLALRAPIAPLDLADALARLVAHHDGLRLRFTRGTDGWRQAYVDAAAAPAALDVVSVDDAAAAIARAQRSLDLANGPVLRAVLYDRRLLLIAHHLVIDGVSWRILVDDLARMLAGGAPLPATASYQAWAAALTGHARGAALAEAAHWRAIAAADTALPADGDERGNTVGSARIACAALDADATRALLTRTPAAYRTRVDDVLLTALALALCEWSGRPSAMIRLEHHGRAPLFDGIDVSRTIGWFTSAYPIELTPAAGLAASLKQIKEQLRVVRHHGVGHGALRYLARDPALATAEPRVTFNYLGQLDSVLDEAGPLAAAPAHEPTGDDRDPEAPRDRWFDVIAMVEGGRLHVEWHYSPALHASATVERLAARMLEHLGALIAHCSDPAQRGATPSDFPLAGLDQAELDGVLARAPLDELEDILPLTPVQDGILFHCLAAPDDGLYITQRTIDLDHAVDDSVGGSLDLTALCTAWQEVAAAHDALRTGFVTHGVRRPIQIVWRTAAVAIERATGELDDVLRADRARGFDLAHPPLMRVTLREVAPGRSQLIWTVHHLLLDGWSAWRVLAEVLARYQAIAGGAPLPIERSAPIRDHLAWLAGLDHARADAYWRDQLASVVSSTLLAPRLASAEGAHREELALSEAATARLRGFAERHALTANTLVQGALAIVIGAYTGSDDVVFGATVSGRGGDLSGGAERVGLFINTLPLRVRLPAAARVVDWLAALQTANAAMREHEHTPLVRAQRQSAVRGALFDTLLVFENYPIARGLGPAAERLGVGATGAHERTSYPLTLEVAPGDRLRLQLDVHGIADGAARSVLLRIAAALDQLTTADRLADVWPVFADERARLARWNATAVEPPTTPATHALFEACADRTPSAIAVIDRDRRLCYGQLDARADQLAWRLIDAGVGPESIVAIGAPRSLELVIGLLAIWKAGAAYLPIDPDYPAARIAHMIDDARPTVVLAGGPFVWPGAWRLDELAPGADRGRPRTPTQRDQLAYCIYTSGSTGVPKGVAVSHASLLNFLAAMQRQLGFDAGDAFLGLTSLSFDIAALELWLPLTRGARLVLAEPEEAASADGLIDRLARGEVTAVQATPTTWRTLSATGPALPATSKLLCGGEPMPPDLAARLVARAPRVLNVYGPTETTVWSTLHALDPAHPEPSIGRPIDNTEIHILDGALRPVPPGATGELTIAGLGLARGYLRRPALTAARFIPDPFGGPGARMYRTGDLARHRADGTLDCLGRSDDQIKLRGHRIELGEIETCLRAQPGVGHAAVAARGPGEARLVAYVVGDPTLEPTLRAALAAALPAIMRPARYAFLAELPRTANGKLDRKALPDPDGAARPPRVAPRTATERTLAELWSRILQRDEIGVEDDFFALGGDSLTALQLVTAARGSGLALSVRDPFEHPTIAALAAHLAAPVAASTDSQPEDERRRFAHSGLDAGELGDLLEDLA